jgi:D-threo-aldose 1-dehydrogenase
MSDLTASRAFGATGLECSTIGVGTAAWGESAALYGLVVPEEDAIRIALDVFESPIRVLDTSNNYGDGESERRIGLAIAERGGLPDGFLLQTKLDRDPVSNSFDPDRMWRSLDESLRRLGVDRVPVLYLHDPENSTFEDLMAPGGPVDALVQMRDRGFANHIGISGGPAGLLTRFVETGVFEAVVTHNRYTLLDETAGSLIDAAAARGLAVLNAAVYGGGLLSTWPRSTDRYHYRTASAAVLSAVDAMGAACLRHGVPLAAAALQHAAARDGVSTVIVGLVTPEQVRQTSEYLTVDISPELWAELRSLQPGPAHWIGD